MLDCFTASDAKLAEQIEQWVEHLTLLKRFWLADMAIFKREEKERRRINFDAGKHLI